MDLFIIAIVGFVIIIFIFIVSTLRATRQSLASIMKETARDLGLRYRLAGMGILDKPRVFGDLDGAEVFMFFKTGRLCVSLRHTLPLEGYLIVTTEADNPDQPTEQANHPTGDPNFAAWRVHGSEFAAAALLDHAVREQFIALALSCWSAEITTSSCSFQVTLAHCGSAAALRLRIDTLRALRKSLLTGTDLRARLVASIKGDPLPGVRRRCLEVFLTQCTLDDEMTELLMALPAESDPALRILAARALGKRGVSLFIDLIREHLSNRKRLEESLLEDIAEGLAHTASADAAAALTELYESRIGTTTRVAVVRALGATGERTLTPFLINELDHHQGAVRAALIAALGDCGDAAAVAPLMAIADDSWLIKDDCEKAIARIQSRLGSVERGWLDLAKPAAAEGNLSLADRAGEGALSRVSGIDLAPTNVSRGGRGKKPRS